MNQCGYVCPQMYCDTNLQGSNYSYTNRQMNTGDCGCNGCVTNSGCINGRQQQKYNICTMPPQAEYPNQCYNPAPQGPSNLFCCNVNNQQQQQDPCCSHMGNYECNSCCTDECCCPQPSPECCPSSDTIIQELKKRIGCPSSRFDRWKTVYQETTDDLARSILRNNIDCRRKIVYPRRCLICDSADQAMTNECLSKIIYPPSSLNLCDVRNCSDYCTGECPAQPPPPMRCMSEENCYRGRPTYHNDLREICNMKCCCR